MKRLMALVLVVFMLCTGMALAEDESTSTRQWRDGMSPSKPYAGLPDEAEVDLTAQLGYWMLFPNDKSEHTLAANACQRLFIYLPREDVVAGDGTFYLCSEKNGQLWSTAMNNTDAITVRKITDLELDGLMWGSGMCFEIVLPETLTLGETYFVNMTRGCIVTEDGTVDNPEIGGTDNWTFTLTGDFGVSAMSYRRAKGDGSYEENILIPQAGDEIRFDLVLGGDAVSAAVYPYFDSVDFLTQLYTESGEVTGLVDDAAPAWGVMFMDADGNEVDRVEFW